MYDIEALKKIHAKEIARIKKLEKEYLITIYKVWGISIESTGQYTTWHDKDHNINNIIEAIYTLFLDSFKDSQMKDIIPAFYINGVQSEFRIKYKDSIFDFQTAKEFKLFIEG